ncbi:3'-5' exonuclease [Zoogloea sp.]|jgi:DNA polymerase III alpha subunit (gram-positive type)|uniref:3'-5' exonuclease n=1 Tax=Zoogloea sp. TaxID=49181 RepID=UPI0035AD9EC9
MSEVYVSVDIETDGPMPGRHSILSLGAAAFTREGGEISRFSVNLEALPGLAPDPRTMAWWATQPAAWSACRRAPEPPDVGMGRFVAWLRDLPGRPVFVAYPAAFDFPFVLHYLAEFVGENPFGYAVIDIRTYAMALLRRPYRASGRSAMPAAWSPPEPHTHVALDDAVEQGRLFCNMLRASHG